MAATRCTKPGPHQHRLHLESFPLGWMPTLQQVAAARLPHGHTPGSPVQRPRRSRRRCHELVGVPLLCKCPKKQCPHDTHSRAKQKASEEHVQPVQGPTAKGTLPRPQNHRPTRHPQVGGTPRPDRGGRPTGTRRWAHGGPTAGRTRGAPRAPTTMSPLRAQ